MTERYTKDFLIREIAARASFSIGDVKIIMRTFEDIIEEMIVDGDELLVGGLFKIYVKTILPHKSFDINTQTHKQSGTTYRITIKPSTTLKNALKNRAKNNSETE